MNAQHKISESSVTHVASSSKPVGEVSLLAIETLILELVERLRRGDVKLLHILTLILHT